VAAAGLRDDPSATLAPLVDALPGLLVAARLWARRRALDHEAVNATFDEALLLLHRHYVTNIPVYRRLALQHGLGDVRDAGVLARELMLTSEVFKAYDPDCLAAGDFQALTTWIGTIFTREPAPVLDGVVDVESWRAALRADGVFVTLSSATTGTPSFVPRDRLTLTAVRSNGDVYGGMAQWHGQDAASFDCLALMARGTGHGLQAAARGLAMRAAHAHHLDVEQGADAAWDAAVAFLREAAASGRPVLVFGPPQRVADLCARANEARLRRLAPGSMIATGGGWKGSQALPAAELAGRIERALGVPARHVVDTYGAAELNCVLIRCAHGRYHLPPLVRAVVLDELLVPVEDDADARGRLGFLDPFALSYPGLVIPGDVARLVSARCPCGLEGQAIVGAIERARDEPPRGCATAPDGAGAGR
jgi:hypothetical protein